MTVTAEYRFTNSNTRILPITILLCWLICTSDLSAQVAETAEDPNFWGGIPQAIVVRTTENLSDGRWRWVVDKARDLNIARINVLVKQDENDYSSKTTGRTLKSGELLVKLPAESTAQGWNDSSWLHEMLAYGKKAGVEIWAWWPTFQDATMAREYPRHAYRSGDGGVFVDASVQGVQLRQEKLLTKLITTYNFDGVSLDWLRYNTVNDGRMGPLTQQFYAVANKPFSEKLLQQPLMNALWYKLRSTAISDWVTGLISRSRTIHPNLRWGAFVLPWQFKEVAQDYRGLAQSGLDFLQPMIYWNNWAQNALWTRQVLSGKFFWLRNSNTRLWPVFDLAAEQSELITGLAQLPQDNLAGISWFVFDTWGEAQFTKLAKIRDNWRQTDISVISGNSKIPALLKNKHPIQVHSKTFSDETAVWMLVCLDALYARDALKSKSVIPVLAFHRFAKGKLGSGKTLWINSTAYLDKLFEFIYKHGFTVIPLSQLQAYMITEDAKLLPARPLVLTVDDGSRSVLEHFHKRAIKAGFPYTISLVTSWVETRSSKIIGEYNNSDTILNQQELKMLDGSGIVELVSHSHASHYYGNQSNVKQSSGPALTTLLWRDGLQRSETYFEYKNRNYTDFIHARNRLKQFVDKNITILAWPYGEFNQASVAAARDAGFTHFLGFAPSRFTTPRWDTSNIDRIAVTRADEGMPLAMPKNARTEQLWWLAFLEVARKTASLELIQATLLQLNALSASHPQAELSRAAVDILRGFSLRGHARINQLLTSNPSDTELRTIVTEFLGQYEPDQ